MRFKKLLFPMTVLVLGSCAGTNQSPLVGGDYYRIKEPISCVPYARDVSGIQIRGNAHTWWGQAQGRYARGKTPVKGAVFVLSKSSRLRYGHVSVVQNVLNSRNIEVTHSNWGHDRTTRSIIYNHMRVEDISDAGDWSLVRFWNYHTNAFGSPYPASGFIYP